MVSLEVKVYEHIINMLWIDSYPEKGRCIFCLDIGWIATLKRLIKNVDNSPQENVSLPPFYSNKLNQESKFLWA